MRAYRGAAATFVVSLLMFGLAILLRTDSGPGVALLLAACVVYAAAMGWAIRSALAARPPLGRHIAVVWMFTVPPLALFLWSVQFTLMEQDLAVIIAQVLAIPATIVVGTALAATVGILARAENRRLKAASAPLGETSPPAAPGYPAAAADSPRSDDRPA